MAYRLLLYCSFCFRRHSLPIAKESPSPCQIRERGGSTSDPTNPQPDDPVNLTIDFDILGVDGNELYAGQDVFLPGMKAKNRVAVKAVGGDAGNWKTRDDADTIDIKYLVSIDDGEWVQWETGYITIGKLDEGDTITETKDYIIPDGISSVAFRTEIDYRNEVEEYDEGDNKSRVEWYEVTILRPDLTVTDVYFSDAETGARYYNGDTLLEDQYWHPYCESTNIGDINIPINVKVSHRMDGEERNDDTVERGDIQIGEINTEVVWNSWKLGDTGTRTYICCVDSKGWLSELNEANNCKSATYHVVSWKPDIIVSDLYLKTNTGQVVRNGNSLPENSYVNPYCEVQNIGNRDAPNGFRIDYQLNIGNRRGDDGVDAGDMRVGAKKTEYMSSSFRLGDTGARSYQCCVDYQGNLSELSEGNNCKSMTFNVYPTTPRIIIDDLWVDYDGHRVNNGGSGKKGKRYHPNVTFHNNGNGAMRCSAEAQYFINADRYRDRDTIDILGVGQSSHERVNNNNIKLGNKGWRSYRVLIHSACGEFPTVERTMSFYVH